MEIERLITDIDSIGANKKLSAWVRSVSMEAATALSTLQAENEKLRAELDDLRIQWDMYGGDVGITAVYKELEQVKRERDAIEQDFRAFAKQWWEQDSGFSCRWCKFENYGGCEWKAKQPNEEKICAGRAFEWRGQKED